MLEWTTEAAAAAAAEAKPEYETIEKVVKHREGKKGGESSNEPRTRSQAAS